ncbi:hypothetical protein HDU78_011518 [Chytriomyces hyalinus]|nr:hypothetical protein HDU78_011518 [Chytriomyces hyalinus]
MLETDIDTILFKLRGIVPYKAPSPASPAQTLVSTVFSFVALLCVGYANRSFSELGEDSSVMIGSFGATAVLLFHAIESPLAQPPNLVFGHVLSAIVGVAVSKLFTITVLQSVRSQIAPALSVALSIGVMGLTNCMHPPAGATALIAVIGSPQIQALGFSYVVRPVITGVAVMLLCAIVFNNLVKGRRYPNFWMQQMWWQWPWAAKAVPTPLGTITAR